MTAESRDKLFSRTEYRRVIAWPERIRREAPFLEKVFAAAPRRKLLDIGCGTGEHSRHFAELGWEAVGVDTSEKMMEDAAQLAGPTDARGTARFELRDAAESGGLPEAPFGGAICLGNMFAFIESEGEMDRILGGIAAALAPGAPFLMQMLNYTRIEEKGLRALPVNVRPLPEEEGEGEIVFVRILSPRGDGTVDFFPVTLTLRPGEDPPVEIRNARQGVHHAWRRETVVPALERAGFADVQARGGLSDAPFSPDDSPDLVIVATREGRA